MRPLPHFALDRETASRLALRLVRAFLIAVVVLAAARVQAAELAGTASVSIVPAPLHLKAKKDLRFGTIADCGKSAGAVTIAATGGRTASGVRLERGGDYGPALFQVKGVSGAGYVITLPSSVTAERKHSRHGAGTLQVTDLTLLSRTLGGTGAAAKIDARGEDQVRVGGTLIVPKSAKPGYYSAEIAMVVSYQ